MSIKVLPDLDKTRKSLDAIRAHAIRVPKDLAEALRRLSLIAYMADAAIARLDGEESYV